MTFIRIVTYIHSRTNSQLDFSLLVLLEIVQGTPICLLFGIPTSHVLQMLFYFQALQLHRVASISLASCVVAQ